jgi:predicted phage tail protein
MKAERSMVNLKLGGTLLVAGAALFLLSDTIFGDSDAASYAMFLGLMLFPVGVVLTLVGIIQVLIVRVKRRTKE